jgi:hypothetical protein
VSVLNWLARGVTGMCMASEGELRAGGRNVPAPVSSSTDWGCVLRRIAVVLLGDGRGQGRVLGSWQNVSLTR